jgi:hypothetical protein
MDSTAVPRSAARLQYALARLPFTLLQRLVVARCWGEDSPVRLSFERFLGSLDWLAGWLLDDAELARRGEALMRRTRDPWAAATERAEEPRGTADEPAADEPLADEPLADEPAAVEPAAQAGAVDVTFTLPAEVHAETVALAGEFNGWSAGDIFLERDSDGSWRVTVPLEPGRSYRYRYLIDGERWENDWHADRYEPNPYGGTDSVIVVG